MEGQQRTGVVLHLLLVGFHHTKGNYIEYFHPPAPSVDPDKPPPCWSEVPFVAVPDGAHAFEEDFVFFTAFPLPTDPVDRLYGVSCYRQIKADAKLKQADAAVTRSAIQKAVVALVRFPVFGAVRQRLHAATQAYFGQGDFSNKSILHDIFASLNTSLTVAQIGKEFDLYLTMDLDVRSLLLTFGRNVIVLLKLVLLGKKLVLHSLPVHRGCVALLSLLSLIPGGLTHLSRDLLRESNLEVPKPDQPATAAESATAAAGPDWSRLGFPLLVFSNAELVKQEWLRVPGKRAHRDMLLLPYAALQHLDEMNAADGFLACVSNELFLNLGPDKVNAIARCGTGAVDLREQSLVNVATVTTADKRFIDYVLATIRKRGQDDLGYEGSDGWVRDMFRTYLGGLLATTAKVPMVFESHYAQPLKLTPETEDYGAAFVLGWIATGCFARWMHRADHLYVSMSDRPLLVHPSGPPSDTLDSLSDSFAESLNDLTAAKDKAKHKLSTFFLSPPPAHSEQPQPQPQQQQPAPGAAAAAPATASTSPSTLDDLHSRAKRWWSSFGSGSSNTLDQSKAAENSKQ